METFEQKAIDVFSEIVINKSFVHKAGFGSRAIPTYVREWIISHYLDDGTELTETSRQKIASFVQKFVPDKSQKETIKYSDTCQSWYECGRYRSENERR